MLCQVMESAAMASRAPESTTGDQKLGLHTLTGPWEPALPPDLREVVTVCMRIAPVDAH